MKKMQFLQLNFTIRQKNKLRITKKNSQNEMIFSIQFFPNKSICKNNSPSQRTGLPKMIIKFKRGKTQAKKSSSKENTALIH
jgi:hypothetical protein